MCLHRVLADEESFGDLAIAQTGGDQLKNFALAPGDAQLAQARLIHSERPRGDRDFLHNIYNHGLFLFCELEAEPYPQSREDCRDQAAVNFDRVLDDQKAVFDKLEENNQESAAEAINENVFFHPDNWRVILARGWRPRLLNFTPSA